MEYEELKQQIELFFNPKACTEAIKGLERFKKDKFLLNILGANLQGKDMRQVQIDSFSTLVDAIEGITNATYPVENPVEYSPLYISALKGGRVPRFKRILAHLNTIKELDARVPQIGISENTVPNIQRNQGYESAEFTYLFDGASYLSLMKLIQDDSDKGKAPIEKRLADLESHLIGLTGAGFKPSNLLENNYGNVLSYLESNTHGPEPNTFAERAKITIDILKGMSDAGFKVEDKAVVNQIGEWAKTGQNGMLDKFQKLSQYLSQESLMYLTGFHPKK